MENGREERIEKAYSPELRLTKVCTEKCLDDFNSLAETLLMGGPIREVIIIGLVHFVSDRLRTGHDTILHHLEEICYELGLCHSQNLLLRKNVVGDEKVSELLRELVNARFKIAIPHRIAQLLGPELLRVHVDPSEYVENLRVWHVLK
jgi:hypothetical protein